MDEQDTEIRIIQRAYLDFLDDEVRDGVYHDKINSMIKAEGIRLIVNINGLRSWNPERAHNLIIKASDELVPLQRALKDIIMTINPSYGKNHEEFYIGLEGSFGSHHITPRTLSSRFLGQIICIEGIVTKCSLIRPKVVRSVHFCPQTGKSIERRYYDLTTLEPHPSSSIYPTKDDDGNLLETEFGLSTYKDHQVITIQEVPEKAPPGQLPRSLDVICDDDLIDVCKPGDRVQIVGTYRSLPGKKEGFTTATFRTVLLANNILELSKDVSPLISSIDVSKIKRFSDQKSKDIFEILAQSLAPSIHGHEYVKRAVLCMLLGGVEKVLPNGTRLRGDINILLIGDPSVAKSQILRYVLKTAPRAVATTGRGSSGVGLTAAVVSDSDASMGRGGGGERRLEAGAMVLADRGIVCIDEFDKMTDADRTAIHEVMEQGRVTVAKAGIHARLNARCSVLAAANPVYGRYDQYKTPMENIGMQDSLLSRFDLLFILLDQANPEQDQKISDHIVRIHQYRAPGEKEGEVLSMNAGVADFLTTYDPNTLADEDDQVGATGGHNTSSEGVTVYEKYDKLLHGLNNKKQRIVSAQFMRKYIHLARKLKPQLSEASTNFISEEYVKLRAQSSVMVDNMARTQPVTARTLETLIRISTAHAKARLSKTVDLLDAEAAVNMVQYAYFKKVVEKPKLDKRDKGDADDSGKDVGYPSSDDFHSSDEESSNHVKKHSRKAQTRGNRAAETDCPERMDTSLDKEGETPTKPTEGTSLTVEKLKNFKKKLLKIFDSFQSESIDLNYVEGHINDDELDTVGSDKYSMEEVSKALDTMTNANQIMIDKDKIFRI